jgi:DNA polymerase III subunit alpha
MHAHTQHSTLDAMTDPRLMVDKAARMRHPGIAFTDHGNTAATVKGYKAAKKHGILFYPGVEAYLVDPEHQGELTDKVKRYHVGLVAISLKGYKALVQFVSKTHTRPRFSRFARCTLADLAELGQQAGQHIILTTGCYFGLVQQRLVTQGSEEAKRAIKAYAGWFPNTFVEIQNHNISHPNGSTDDDIVLELTTMADELGLPILATQDAHYLNQLEKQAHALMKRMVYGGVEDEFPGDSFHLATDEWVEEHYDSRTWARVLSSCDDIVDMHALSIPPLDTFKLHMPSVAKYPWKTLRDRCFQVLMSMGNVSGRYTARLNEELLVIKDLGMSDYFLHWDNFVKWCRQQKICIEARGSANGSLVCYLLGVTQVDPIKWGLSHERFISRDRIKPPDVDMDIEDSRRDEAIRYLNRMFETMRIGTWGKIGITVDEQTGEERGSVLVTYNAGLRRECEQEARRYAERKGLPKGKVKDLTFAFFNKRYGEITSMEDVRRISRRDYRALRQINHMDSVYKSYGQHAGGVLLGPDDMDMDISEYVPTMLVGSSNAIVTQYDMDDVEEFGFFKDDILGQSSLTAMRICQELMGQSDPTDFTWIPDNDREACKLLREGRVDNGIFHFEGYTKARGGKEMGVKSTKDAVVASALYMPGCVESGQKDRYISTRRSPTQRQRQIQAAKDTHPLVYEVLAETNGVMVFQDHPLQILRRIGMSVADVNVTYKILKDSGRGAIERNRARLAEIKGHYDTLCAGKGVNNPEVLWKSITGFMAYGFGKAHSTGYGIRSYRTAYLKAHYPLEFMTAMLQVWAGRKTQKKDREVLYVREARRIGLRILPPDVNISGPSWTIDRKRGAIRRGLVSIRGIGPKGAYDIAAAAPYRDMDDLMRRVGGASGYKNWLTKKIVGGRIQALKNAGALESLGVPAP